MRRFQAVEEFVIEVYRRGAMDEVRLLLELVESESELPLALQETARVELGTRVEAVPVPARSLPRDELKARRAVRRAGS